MRPYLISVILVVVVSVPSIAAETPASEATRTTTVFGNDPCPAARAGEIVVCGRLPESERYRIPKQFREKPREENGASASWASKVRTLEDAQRFTRPNSCSVVGSGGQTGCTAAMIRQWFLERQAQRKSAP